MAKITCKVAGKNLRRKTLTCQPTDVFDLLPANKNLGAHLVGSFPSDSRVAISEIRLVVMESLVGASQGTIQVGHATIDSGYVSGTTIMGGYNTTVANSPQYKTTVLTLASSLKNNSSWPNLVVLPKGSSVVVSWAEGGLTAGKAFLSIDYWELDDQYD